MKKLKLEELHIVSGAYGSCVPNMSMEADGIPSRTDCFTDGVPGKAHKVKLDGGDKNGPGSYWCNDVSMGSLPKNTIVQCPIGESIRVRCNTNQKNHCRGWGETV